MDRLRGPGGLMSPAPIRRIIGADFASLLDDPILDTLDAELLERARVSIPGLGTTDNVVRDEHVVPVGPGVRLRSHRPKGIAGPLPCVYSIHGGGFVLGSYDMDDHRFESLCTEVGVMGISVDYRLAPEHHYPDPLEDCLRGLRWTFENAERLGVDRACVGVFGASAGGGLAAALALLVRDTGEFPLAFQLLESPMLDDRQQTPSSTMAGLPIWGRAANEFGWRAYLGDAYGWPEVPPYAAPARAIELEGLPPTFISVGSADGFRDEDIEYALRLSQAGVPTELHVYPGAPHGYQLFSDTAVARQSNRDADDWLLRQVGTRDPYVG